MHGADLMRTTGAVALSCGFSYSLLLGPGDRALYGYSGMAMKACVSIVL